MLKELVLKNRSYRRFEQNEAISRATLEELVELARLSPSGGNRQGLKYLLSNTAQRNALIFETLGWAAYLPDWDGPAEGERPGAYIVMVKDRNMGSMTEDVGIAAQSILLGAVEKGLGGCMFGNIKRQELASRLNLAEQYEIALVIALGKPREEVVLEAMAPDGDVKYWRDANQVHHVPKRSLAEIILD